MAMIAVLYEAKASNVEYPADCAKNANMGSFIQTSQPHQATNPKPAAQPSRLIHATLKHGDEGGEQHFGQAGALLPCFSRA